MPDRTTIVAAFRSLGIAARTGFIGGFGSIAAPDGAQGSPGAPFNATINLHTSGDPMEVERAVVGALRRYSGHNGVAELGAL